MSFHKLNNELTKEQSGLPYQDNVLTTTAVADSPQTQSVWTPYLNSKFDDKDTWTVQVC